MDATRGFYVSHMAPIQRTLVHRGCCRDCNDGTGQVGQHKTGSGNTGWSPKFDSFAEAAAYQEHHFARYKVKRSCQRCKPDREIPPKAAA